MSPLSAINPQIMAVLSEYKSNEFTIPEIRDELLRTAMKHKSKSTVRLFVSRHLNALVERGLLTSQGTRKQRVFSKSEQFSAQVIGTTDKNIPKGSDLHEGDAFFTTLTNSQNQLKAELAMLFGEIEEYDSIIKQFPQTQNKVALLHQESKLNAATITGQITAITKTINLLQRDAS
ncbi:hypothetical protein ACPSL3_08640 [Vibrio owensii]|uniref:hypothetical protein n=1 Tax=Vibrio harveyi group TaxID=717610 RepID=UPI002380BC4E|nr:hypothetical protein [Vibrio harveyi]